MKRIIIWLFLGFFLSGCAAHTGVARSGESYHSSGVWSCYDKSDQALLAHMECEIRERPHIIRSPWGGVQIRETCSMWCRTVKSWVARERGYYDRPEPLFTLDPRTAAPISPIEGHRATRQYIEESGARLARAEADSARAARERQEILRRLVELQSSVNLTAPAPSLSIYTPLERARALEEKELLYARACRPLESEEARERAGLSGGERYDLERYCGVLDLEIKRLKRGY